MKKMPSIFGMEKKIVINLLYNVQKESLVTHEKELIQMLIEWHVLETFF